MRTTSVLVLLAAFGLAACSATNAPSHSALSNPSPAVEATSSPSIEPTPSRTVAASPSESEEPTPTPAILAIDRAEGERLLLSGVRQDLQDACRPIDTAVPRSAVSGVRSVVPRDPWMWSASNEISRSTRAIVNFTAAMSVRASCVEV